MHRHYVRSCCLVVSTAIFLGCLPPAISYGGTFKVANRKEMIAVKRRAKASLFLSHTTFGPTKSDINSLVARMEQIGDLSALEEWIDNQVGLPATLHKPKAMQMMVDDGFIDPVIVGINQNRYKHHAWWDTVLSADDQLRQRMAWALAQIFAVDQGGAGFGSRRIDASGLPQYLGIVDFYDMLVSNAVGNYRTTLEDVTLHPVMGVWLSHVRNRKGDPVTGRFPDENYGREVQQLLTIGLYQLNSNGTYKRDNTGNQIPTYTNEEIKSFARVFTGLHYDSGTNFYSPVNLHAPMIMFEGQHDTDAKVLHNGTTLPAGQSGMQDIRDALDNLFEHSSVGPFLSRLLIQRLVKSNPSKGYIRRVANTFVDNGSGVRGDLAAVAKAIFLDKEATNALAFSYSRKAGTLAISSKSTEHTRLREPVLRYTALIRGFKGSSDYSTGRFMIPDLNYSFNQMAYRHHHIFNFYSPDHRPAGDIQNYIPSKRIPNGTMFAPEFEIFTAVAANRMANRFRAAVIDANEYFVVLNSSTHGRFEGRVNLEFTEQVDLAPDPDALLANLDLLLCNGTMKDSTRQSISQIIADETTDPTVRARAAIIATLTSAECAIGE